MDNSSKANAGGGGGSPRGSKRPAEDNSSAAAMTEEAAAGGESTGVAAEKKERGGEEGGVGGVQKKQQGQEDMEEVEGEGDLAATRGDLDFCHRTEVRAYCRAVSGMVTHAAHVVGSCQRPSTGATAASGLCGGGGGWLPLSLLVPPCTKKPPAPLALGTGSLGTTGWFLEYSDT